MRKYLVYDGVLEALAKLGKIILEPIKFRSDRNQNSVIGSIIMHKIQNPE